MGVLSKFMVMHDDERLNRRLHILQLTQSHLVIFREEFERFDGESVLLKRFGECLL